MKTLTKLGIGKSIISLKINPETTNCKLKVVDCSLHCCNSVADSLILF